LHIRAIWATKVEFSDILVPLPRRCSAKNVKFSLHSTFRIRVNFTVSGIFKEADFTVEKTSLQLVIFGFFEKISRPKAVKKDGH